MFRPGRPGAGPDHEFLFFFSIYRRDGMMIFFRHCGRGRVKGGQHQDWAVLGMPWEENSALSSILLHLQIFM